MSLPHVCIAILARDKEVVLPLYCKCLQEQSYPKKNISLYVRSNNNADNTVSFLKKWIESVRDDYAEVYENYEDLENIEYDQHRHHDWTSLRFSILGKIRQDSLQWASERGYDYFVIDCDNFIVPQTLISLVETHLPIVGPLLRHNSNYANYHNEVDNQGYMNTNSSGYFPILHRYVKGLILVDVIHCTYYIQSSFLNFLQYCDNSTRHEYVIFSESARNHKIPQYLDNRQDYGYLTFATTFEELENESWYRRLTHQQKMIISPQCNFGNRLRSMASLIYYGLQDQRQLSYIWMDTSRFPTLGHYRDYFVEKIPEASPEDLQEVTGICTEWLPGEYWYNFQSSGQRLVKNSSAQIARISREFKSDKDFVLVETSLCCNISNVDLYRIYSHYFIPLPRYLHFLENVPENLIGISIRRGDLLDYFPEANQKYEDIVAWILKKFSPNASIFLSSDDSSFISSVISKVTTHYHLFCPNMTFFSATEVPFVKFCILSKCKEVYGTPHSSFAYEASIYGGKMKYGTILS
jgi:hypothetical protein